GVTGESRGERPCATNGQRRLFVVGASALGSSHWKPSSDTNIGALQLIKSRRLGAPQRAHDDATVVSRAESARRSGFRPVPSFGSKATFVCGRGRALSLVAGGVERDRRP